MNDCACPLGRRCHDRHSLALLRSRPRQLSRGRVTRTRGQLKPLAGVATSSANVIASGRALSGPAIPRATQAIRALRQRGVSAGQVHGRVTVRTSSMWQPPAVGRARRRPEAAMGARRCAAPPRAYRTELGMYRGCPSHSGRSPTARLPRRPMLPLRSRLRWGEPMTATKAPGRARARDTLRRPSRATTGGDTKAPWRHPVRKKRPESIYLP